MIWIILTIIKLRISRGSHMSLMFQSDNTSFMYPGNNAILPESAPLKFTLKVGSIWACTLGHWNRKSGIFIHRQNLECIGRVQYFSVNLVNQRYYVSDNCASPVITCKLKNIYIFDSSWEGRILEFFLRMPLMTRWKAFFNFMTELKCYHISFCIFPFESE